MHVGAAVTLISLGDAAVGGVLRRRAGGRQALRQRAVASRRRATCSSMPLQPPVAADGGWALVGAKRFVSGCEIADYLLVNALVDGVPELLRRHRGRHDLVRPDLGHDGPAGHPQPARLARGHAAARRSAVPAARARPRRTRSASGWRGCRSASPRPRSRPSSSTPRGRVIPTTGKPLSHMQWVQFDVADAARARCRRPRLLAAQTMWLADQRSPDGLAAAIEAKLLANQVATDDRRARRAHRRRIRLPAQLADPAPLP